MTEAEIVVTHGPEFRRCLLELDVPGIRRLWEHCAPHLSQMTAGGALYSLHLARTQAKCVPLRMKQYSQRWLNERHLGSFLPNDKRGH